MKTDKVGAAVPEKMAKQRALMPPNYATSSIRSWRLRQAKIVQSKVMMRKVTKRMTTITFMSDIISN